MYLKKKNISNLAVSGACTSRNFRNYLSTPSPVPANRTNSYFIYTSSSSSSSYLRVVSPRHRRRHPIIARAFPPRSSVSTSHTHSDLSIPPTRAHAHTEFKRSHTRTVRVSCLFRPSICAHLLLVCYTHTQVPRPYDLYTHGLHRGE